MSQQCMMDYNTETHDSARSTARNNLKLYIFSPFSQNEVQWAPLKNVNNTTSNLIAHYIIIIN